MLNMTNTLHLALLFYILFCIVWHIYLYLMHTSLYSNCLWRCQAMPRPPSGLMVLCAIQVVQRDTKMCNGFRPSQFMQVILNLENCLISSLNDYCKQKKTPEISYRGSSRLVLSHFDRTGGPGLPALHCVKKFLFL
jgi:hypothetical protein